MKHLIKPGLPQKLKFISAPLKQFEQIQRKVCKIVILTKAPLQMGETVCANQISALIDDVTPSAMEMPPLITWMTPRITTATTTAYTMVTRDMYP